MKLSLGTDIGGTNTRVGVVSDQGEVLKIVKFSTGDYEGAEAYADALAECAKGVISEYSDAEWAGMGIGAPNGNQRSGTIEYAANLKMEGIVPFAEMMQTRLNMSVNLTNDANAAALGEKLYGAAKDYDDFIMITLGTGLGSGVFVNGELVSGASGFAGELGHVSVIPDGRRCGFGRRGSLETYCSATGIRRTYFEKLAEMGCETALDHIPVGEITSKHIADAAVSGDPVCEAAMEFTGQLLGQSLASAALITAPAAFFLFGGPVQAGGILIDTARRHFEEHLIPAYKGKIEIIVSALPPDDAAILGAAALVAGEESMQICSKKMRSGRQ